MKKDELIRDYKSNQSLNIEMIYEDFYNYVYTIVVNITKGYLKDEDMEEVILDTFLVLWKNRNKLDDAKKIKPYIAGITKNLIKEKTRKNKIHLNLSDYENKIENIDRVDTIIEENEERLLVKNIIEKLNKKDKEILKLYYYENIKIKDIAKYLNVSEFTIKQRLYRIRKTIKKIIEKEGGYRYEK